jgi:hypothetical protein
LTPGPIQGAANKLIKFKILNTQSGDHCYAKHRLCALILEQDKENSAQSLKGIPMMADPPTVAGGLQVN